MIAPPFTPEHELFRKTLRDYAVREPAADEVTRATTGDETVAVSGK